MQGLKKREDSFLFWILVDDLNIFTEVTSTILCSYNRGPPGGKRKPRMDFLSWVSAPVGHNRATEPGYKTLVQESPSCFVCGSKDCVTRCVSHLKRTEIWGVRGGGRREGG